MLLAKANGGESAPEAIVHHPNPGEEANENKEPEFNLEANYHSQASDSLASNMTAELSSKLRGMTTESKVSMNLAGSISLLENLEITPSSSDFVDVRERSSKEISLVDSVFEELL